MSVTFKWTYFFSYTRTSYYILFSEYRYFQRKIRKKYNWYISFKGLDTFYCDIAWKRYFQTFETNVQILIEPFFLFCFEKLIYIKRTKATTMTVIFSSTMDIYLFIYHTITRNLTHYLSSSSFSIFHWG